MIDTLIDSKVKIDSERVIQKLVICLSEGVDYLNLAGFILSRNDPKPSKLFIKCNGIPALLKFFDSGKE